MGIRTDYIQVPKMMITTDLLENEELCSHCKGLGFLLREKIATVNGKNKEKNIYYRQWFDPCPFCDEGIIRKCSQCKKQMRERSLVCSHCKEKASAEELDGKKDITSSDYKGYIYDVYMNRTFHDLDDMLEYYKEEEVPLPEVVFSTCKHTLHFDASNLIEEACQFLHEDALDSIELGDIDELQFLLDEWAATQPQTDSYTPDYSAFIDVKKWIAENK